MIKVRVPATSANLGAGFDSMGVALDVYNEIHAALCDKAGFTIETDPDLPADGGNLVARSMRHVFDLTGFQPRGVRIRQVNNIPKTSGMGSSAACIAGGVFAANALAGGVLNERRLIDLCAELDGHPDNVVPCITGGVTACLTEGGRVTYLKAVPRGIKVLAMIPSFTLATAVARKALPDSYTREDAVYNIGRAALTFGALCTGKYELLRRCSGDRIHQPYRRNLIEDFDGITELVLSAGALSAYLSGAGPSVVAFIAGEFDERVLVKGLAKYPKWHYRICGIPEKGIEVYG
jgi:homoserine kinase